MHTRNRWNKSPIKVRNRYREHLLRENACLQLSRPVTLEKLSQQPLPPGDSCVLIIFGAWGDLSKRKLIPGLYNLACEGCMNPEFEVLGIGRTLMSSKDVVRSAGKQRQVERHTRLSEPGWRKTDQAQNHLSYVSTPASVAGPMIEGLGAVGPNHRVRGWTRIVLERPFGRPGIRTCAE